MSSQAPTAEIPADSEDRPRERSRGGAIDVSVLIPVYNERDNVAPLFDELVAVFASMPGVVWEVVFVDDGSRDDSREVLRELAAKRPDIVVVIELRRNYGQTAALDAGLRYARGQVLVPMDADGQNDPAEIPRMLAEIARGADVVSGWRRKRQDAFLSRRVPSIIANRLIARVTGVPIHDFGCTLKAYRRSVLENVRLYGEMHRFIPAYAKWNGASVIELEVNHRPRTRGTSKYGIMRTFKVLLDLLTVIFLQGGYASRPLHVFGGIGFSMIFGAFALAGVTLYEKLEFPIDDPRHMFVHRNPLALLAAMVLILGTGAIAMGLMAELLARIYHSTGGSSYSIAGGRNTLQLPTPEAARALSPELRKLGSQ